VVWSGKGWGSNPGSLNIQYRMRETTSGGWLAREAVSDFAADTVVVMTPAIAVDSADNIHVVWNGVSGPVIGNQTYVQYRERLTSGGWQTQEQLSNNPYHFTNRPSIVIDSSDKVHVAWQAIDCCNAPWNLYGKIFYRARYYGTLWLPEEIVAEPLSQQFDPTLSVDASDNVHVVWYGGKWGTYPYFYQIVQRTRRADGLWLAQTLITDGPVSQIQPALVSTLHPTVSGEKPNRPNTGYAFVWLGSTQTDQQLRFYASSDLSWDGDLDTSAPSAPVNVIATADSITSMLVSWGASSD
jgi:hypothetical protein